MSINKNNIPLNQILFGHNGTGKINATVDEALKIIAPEFFESNRDNREKLKARFDEAVNVGDVRSVTFQHSYSYENFVEDLRTETKDDGQLHFEVVAGVFKQLCDLASSKFSTYANSSIDIAGRKIWVMRLGHRFDAYIYDECIEKDIALLGEGGGIDFTGCQTNLDVFNRFQLAGSDVTADSYDVWAVSAFVLKVKPGDLIVVPDGFHKFRAIGEFAGDYENILRSELVDPYTLGRKVNWLRKYSPSLARNQLLEKNMGFNPQTISQTSDLSINLKKLQSLLSNQIVDSNDGQKPYVLVIDDINRGNISRIFGELITLIEPSKRDGMAEACKVTLPYSKKEFSMPRNVYLIGTINTADCSLAELDIALRRLFTFKEVKP